MKLLNDFANKIREISYLYECNEFQVFIQRQEDFLKVVGEIKEAGIVEIAEDFKERFSECLFTYSSTDNDQVIQESLQTLTSALQLFESFEKECKTNVDNFLSFETEMNNLMSGVGEIVDFYAETYAFDKPQMIQRESFTNPYIILLDWTRLQILDLQAIIDAIAKRNSIERMKTLVAEKHERELKTLNEIRVGKKKFSQMFSSKSKSDMVREQETIVQNLEIEIKGIDSICKINSERIVQLDLPAFKKSKRIAHEAMLRTFAAATSEEYDQMTEQLKPLSQLYSGIY